MFKLKVAVGISGRVLALEKFPNDEKHAYLDEMIPDLEDYADVNEPAGVYEADIGIEQSSSSLMGPEYDSSYLVINGLRKLD